MIVDGRSIEAKSEVVADICIVGGGPAGLTLAMELEALGLRIVVLESGGQDYDVATQDLYSGYSIGLSYEPLELSRTRQLGGSSNCWGGWCRPLGQNDFDRKSWVPNSGWPLTYEELKPFYDRSQSYLSLPSADYDIDHWKSELAARNLSPFNYGAPNPLIENLISQFSPPVRYGVKYEAHIRQSSALNVILWANASEVLVEAGADNVSSKGVVVKTLGGPEFTVKARLTVLAAGGIENARLLLLSHRVIEAGIGNTYDNVGRYFMDHPRVRSSSLIIQNARAHRLLYDARLAKTNNRIRPNPNKIAAFIAPTVEAQRERGINNSRSYIVGHHIWENTSAYQGVMDLRAGVLARSRFGRADRTMAALGRKALTDAMRSPWGLIGLVDKAFNPHVPKRLFSLETVFEPTPNRESRLYLSEHLDTLGLRKPCLDWKLTEADHLNMSKTIKLVSSEFERHGIGQVVFDDGDVREEPRDIKGCWHHMGTTRMDDDAKQGVVDSNLKVHGVSNLYCVGSSVFPSVGCDFPTLTLVALSIRLADRLKTDFNSLADASSESARA